MMDKLTLVDKLRSKTNISYEQAKNALEKCNWDILDAIIYLEENEVISKPNISVFYTNESKENYSNINDIQSINKVNDNEYSQSKNNFQGVFEIICRVIDTCNNISVEIKRKQRRLVNLPLTVVILLFFFAFWVLIPLMIVGIFFEIEFSVHARSINTNKVNKILDDMSKIAKDIKGKINDYIGGQK